MCWGKVFTFGVPAHAATRCGHTKRRMIRCSNTDVCEEVAQEDTYTHAGECPDCLMGVVFPAHSYEQPEVERGRGLQSSTVLDACRQRAQQLVYFSVMWLVGGYDQAREVHDDGPLATNAAEQRRMDLVVLHHYLDTTRCVECGRRSLTAPCACPGVRAIEQSVANPAILFHHKVVRQIYRDQFLRGVQRGHYRDVMAQIEHGPRAPAPIKPEVAAQLLHRNRSASPNDILQRQNGLSTMVSEFYCELYSTRTESPDFGTTKDVLSKGCYRSLASGTAAFTAAVPGIFSESTTQK